MAIPRHGGSAAQGPGAALGLGQEEARGAVQAETDIQRQEQAHRGETLGPDRESGEEGMRSGRWGARQADGWSDEVWRNPSKETLDPSTAANGTRLFRGKLVRYILTLLRTRETFIEPTMLFLTCQTGTLSPKAGREFAWS